MRKQYIAIEGNIGVGKTTLAKILAPKIQAELALENFKKNHFLPLFYADMDKYGLHVELSFLVDRLKDMSLLNKSENLISDYFFLKTLVFAKNNLDNHSYKIFEQVFKVFQEKVMQPDLVIYLKRNVDNLLNNIEKRGRKIESTISADYLLKIQKSYDQFLLKSTNLKIVVLDISDIDFNKQEEKVNDVISILNRKYKPGISKIKL